MLLIGSRAARYHWSDFPHANDYDLIGSADEIADWILRYRQQITKHRLRDDQKKVFISLRDRRKFEFEIVYPESSAELITKVSKDYMMDDFYVASPQMLMLIKLSHLRHPIKWQKHIEDYHFIKSRLHAGPHEKELMAYARRKAEVDARQKRREICLNMSNEQFFAKSQQVIARIYEHDDLHRATCYYGKPLYETLKKDTNKALMDRGMFEQQTHLDKLRTVREECFAIALERIIIPAIEIGKAFDEQEAFMYAFQRVCTTLTKGWFREFCLEHYLEIKSVDRDYVGFFLDAVSDGRVRRLEHGQG